MANTSAILQRADETLATARYGLDDLLGAHPPRRLTGLRNLIVFARAVTNVLQNLRSTETTFNAWYAPYQTEMRDDPLLRFFYEMRSEILKEGTLTTSSSTHVKSLRLPEDLERLAPRPSNATAFFIGDRFGGSGWEVALPDGSTAKFYVELPADIAVNTLEFPNAPTRYLQEDLESTAIGILATLYLEYLERLLAAARAAFMRSS